MQNISNKETRSAIEALLPCKCLEYLGMSDAEALYRIGGEDFALSLLPNKAIANSYVLHIRLDDMERVSPKTSKMKVSRRFVVNDRGGFIFDRGTKAATESLDAMLSATIDLVESFRATYASKITEKAEAGKRADLSKSFLSTLSSPCRTSTKFSVSTEGLISVNLSLDSSNSNHARLLRLIADTV
ncbi:hypothetical protein [Vibrio crassostreae]|uniref:hypothetical protein n=1 Tax=Vibrio crassostreae TaxID=246167 RepID=UPI001B310AC8|nr:hypothetical protein [Vibrio crassostreae]